MILAIDIGNTNISMALMKGGRVLKTWIVPTNLSNKSLRKRIKQALHFRTNLVKSIQAVVICSVVPKASAIVKSIMSEIFKQKPYIIGRDIKVPIKNLYRQPSQVGQDRLVCAYAAMKLYGVPCIVVDFGTAITFDVVSKKKEYLGGAIIPGLRLFAESLYEKTALLPKVKIQKPKEVIGRDTKNSILSGIFYGYGALCDGMINVISHKLRHRSLIILTGGYMPLIQKFIKKEHRIDKFLIFKGIALLYQNFVN